MVGPPKRLQWLAGSRFSRHHDRMSSLSALVSAAGRVFYIFDEAPRVSILLEPEWKLIARDAFSGVVLWNREIGTWHSHLFPLKSGPAQLPRRLVASGERVFVTLDIDGPVVALDAASGKTLRTYEGTEGTEELIVLDGVLYVAVSPGNWSDASRARRRGHSWKAEGWKVVALRAESGEALWTRDGPVLPNTLAADSERVVLHDGECIVGVDRASGAELWRSTRVARSDEILIAGPEDLIDEEKALRTIDTAETRTRLEEQHAAWRGERGATLWTVSADRGRTLRETRLETPPVFDGMAVAGGSLYLAGMDGSVTRLGNDPAKR